MTETTEHLVLDIGDRLVGPRPSDFSIVPSDSSAWT